MPPARPQPPRMTPYANRRSRKYLHHDEVVRMVEAARRTGRHGLRNAALIWMMYRHGLRAREVRGLTWSQVQFDRSLLYVWRCKNGKMSIHLLGRHELEVLRRLRPEEPFGLDPVFVTERGGPLGHPTIYKVVARAGKAAGLDVPVNPHMLRHSCGFHLANQRRADTRRVQEYLGHRDIRHTVRYTELDEAKFEGLWDADMPLDI